MSRRNYKTDYHKFDRKKKQDKQNKLREVKKERKKEVVGSSGKGGQ